jgi:hypothetical protein
MNQLHIPDMTNILNARPVCRDLLRALAGAGLGVAATRLANPGVTEAGKKGKKKRKKAQPQMAQVCQPGAAIGSVSVPATGATVSTPVLAQGQRYRLRASGFWITNAITGNDAFAAFPFANPGAPGTTYQGVRLGLSVNGDSPDQWGSYTTTHIYERQVTGQGTALSLRYTDPIPADNSGSLIVDIYCV